MVSVAGNTLIEIMRACAQEIGTCQTVTATSLSGSALVVIASGMIDSEAAAEKYGGHYLYCTTGNLIGQQCRVARSGFAGASGTFTLSNPFIANVPESGSVYLLSGSMPPIDQDALVGIRTCVNRALRKLWVIDKLDIVATSGTLQYDLAAYWWMSKERAKRLLDPDPGASGHQVAASQGWQVVQDGDLWTLELGSGYATGETFSLLVERPLNSRLYLSGAWADQASPTAGLALGADACLGEWNHVFQASLYECMKQLAVQAGGNRKSYWEQRAAEQRAIVATIKAYQVDSVEMSLGEGQEDSPSAWSDLGDKGLFSGRGY